MFSGSMAAPIVPKATPVPTPAPSYNSQNIPLLSATTPLPDATPKPVVPAVPSTYSSPAPVTPSMKTTQSGIVANGSTGGVIQPAIPVVPQTQTPQFDTTTGMPTAPTVSPTGTPATFQGPMYTSPEYEAALKTYQGLSVPTAEEVQNTQDMNNLESSFKTAYTNAEGQAIPLDFITGQQKRLQDTALNLEQPLQAKATLLQARRTAALEASKYALDNEAGKIKTYQDLNKPTAVAFGTSLVNPSTGKTTFGGNGAGSAMDTIGTAISEGRLTPDMVTRYGAASIASALEKDPGYNFVTQKASIASDSASLKKQQDYYDTTSRSFKTATDNLGVLTKFMTDNGINQSGIPLINQLTNKVKAGTLDPGAVAAFNSQLSGLRAEYAQVLSRGGEVTDSSRATANSLIPDNLTPEQMQKITTQLSLEGGNALKEAQAGIDTIKSRTGTNMGKSTTNSSTPATGKTVMTKIGAIPVDF